MSGLEEVQLGTDFALLHRVSVIGVTQELLTISYDA